MITLYGYLHSRSVKLLRLIPSYAYVWGKILRLISIQMSAKSCIWSSNRQSKKYCDFCLDFLIPYYALISIRWNVKDEFLICCILRVEHSIITINTLINIFWTLNTLRGSSMILFLIQNFIAFLWTPGFLTREVY